MQGTCYFEMMFPVDFQHRHPGILHPRALLQVLSPELGAGVSVCVHCSRGGALALGSGVQGLTRFTRTCGNCSVELLWELPSPCNLASCLRGAFWV